MATMDLYDVIFVKVTFVTSLIDEYGIHAPPNFQ